MSRPNTEYHGLAAMQARSQRPSAASVLAIVATVTMTMDMAAVSDGSHGAVARVSIATAGSEAAAKQPQSLPWLSAEA